MSDASLLYMLIYDVYDWNTRVCGWILFLCSITSSYHLFLFIDSDH